MFLSFFLMLVFMTYNVSWITSYLVCVLRAIIQAYLILATVIGAALGHFIFSSHMNIDVVLYGGGENKGMACH